MGHAQPLQVVDTGGPFSLPIQGRAGTRKRGELAPILVRKTTGGIPGEILHVQFINHSFRSVVGSCVLYPTGRIGFAQIQDHTTVTVDTTGFGVGVCGAACLSIYSHIKIVVPAIQIAGGPERPHTLFAFFHGDDLRGGS